MKITPFSYTNQDKKGQNFIVFSYLQWHTTIWIEKIQQVENPFFPFEPLPHTVQALCDINLLMSLCASGHGQNL